MMMRRTRRTSIIGVTLISALLPIFMDMPDWTPGVGVSFRPVRHCRIMEIDMRMAVVSLPGYEKEIGKLLTATERRALENHLAENPEIHPVVPGTSGVRKARWSRGTSGKSGGIRAIYYFRSHRGVIYMMAAYAKSAQTTLTAADKKMLRRLVAEIKTTSEVQDG